MIILDDIRRDTLPLYEVKELSVEEAMWAIARDKMPDNLGLPEDYPAAAFAPGAQGLDRLSGPPATASGRRGRGKVVLLFGPPPGRWRRSGPKPDQSTGGAPVSVIALGRP